MKTFSVILILAQMSRSIFLASNGCKHFFSVVVSYDSLTCSNLLKEEAKNLEFLNLQMTSLNTQVTIFASAEVNDCPQVQIQPNNLSSVLIHPFNGSRMLELCNFSIGTIRILNTWPPTRSFSLRKTEIYRLCIARMTSMAYIDLDTVLLSASSEIFEREFVAVEVSRNMGFSLQFSNSAFCLCKRTLDMMMDYQDKRIHLHDNYVTQERLVYNEEDQTATTVLDFRVVANNLLMWKPTELGFDTFYIVLSRPHHGHVAYYRQSHPFMIRYAAVGSGSREGLSKFMERCLFYKYKLVQMPYSAVAFVASISSHESYVSTLSNFRQSYLDVVAGQLATGHLSFAGHKWKHQLQHPEVFSTPMEGIESASSLQVKGGERTTEIESASHNNTLSQSRRGDHSVRFLCSAIFTTLDEILVPDVHAQGISKRTHRRLIDSTMNNNGITNYSRENSKQRRIFANAGVSDPVNAPGTHHKPNSCCFQLQQLRHGHTQEIIINMINQVSRLEGPTRDSNERLVVFVERSGRCAGCFCGMLKSIEEAANITAARAKKKMDSIQKSPGDGVNSGASVDSSVNRGASVEIAAQQKGKGAVGAMWDWLAAWARLESALIWQNAANYWRRSHAVIATIDTTRQQLNDPSAHHLLDRRQQQHRQCQISFWSQISNGALRDATAAIVPVPVTASAPAPAAAFGQHQSPHWPHSLDTAAAYNDSRFGHFSKPHKLRRIEKTDAQSDFKSDGSDKGGGEDREGEEDEQEEDDDFDDEELQTDKDINYEDLLQTVSQRARIVEFDRDALLSSCVRAALDKKADQANQAGNQQAAGTAAGLATDADTILHKILHPAAPDSQTNSAGVADTSLSSKKAPRFRVKSKASPKAQQEQKPAVKATNSKSAAQKSSTVRKAKQSGSPGAQTQFKASGRPGTGKKNPKISPKLGAKTAPKAVPMETKGGQRVAAATITKSKQYRSGEKHRRLSEVDTEDSLKYSLDHEYRYNSLDNIDSMDNIGSGHGAEGVATVNSVSAPNGTTNIAAELHSQEDYHDYPPGEDSQGGAIRRRRRLFDWETAQPKASSPVRGDRAAVAAAAAAAAVSTRTVDTSSSEELQDLVHACLAWRYGMTYVSPEMLLMLKSSRVYRTPFIAVAAKKQTQRPGATTEGHAGVTANAYCLPPHQLLDVIYHFIMSQSAWYSATGAGTKASPQHTFHEDLLAVPLLRESPALQRDGVPAKRVIRKSVSTTLRAGHDKMAFSPISAALQSLLLGEAPVRMLTQSNPRTVTIPKLIEEVKELGLSLVSISPTIFLHAHKIREPSPRNVDVAYEAMKKRAEDLADSPQDKSSPFYIADSISEYEAEGFDAMAGATNFDTSEGGDGGWNTGRSGSGGGSSTNSGNGGTAASASAVSTGAASSSSKASATLALSISSSGSLTFRGVVKALREGVRDAVPTMSPIMALFNLTEWEGMILP